MKKIMALAAAALVLSTGSFAQTTQPKRMDSTHKMMKKPMKKMKRNMDSSSMSSDSSMTKPMR